MGADTKANTNLWGAAALKVGDLCLLEDGSECSSALGSDAIVEETASEGCGMANGERVGVSTALTGKQTLAVAARFERGLLE